MSKNKKKKRSSGSGGGSSGGGLIVGMRSGIKKATGQKGGANRPTSKKSKKIGLIELVYVALFVLIVGYLLMSRLR